MADAIAIIAIELLETRAAEIRKQADREATQLEQMAVDMRQRLGLPNSSSVLQKTSKSAPGIFEGMEKSFAVQLYMRSRSTNDPIPLSQIVRDLSEGGCFLGAQKDRWERNVWAVARQSKQYHSIESDDGVGSHLIQLAPSAWEKPRTRSRAKRSHS